MILFWAWKSVFILSDYYSIIKKKYSCSYEKEVIRQSVTKYLFSIFFFCIVLQSATCFVSSNGIKVTVEDAKCVQANAFVQRGIFQEFVFKEESATFRINLNILLVIKVNLCCLKLYSSTFFLLEWSLLLF